MDKFKVELGRMQWINDRKHFFALIKWRYGLCTSSKGF